MPSPVQTPDDIIVKLDALKALEGQVAALRREIADTAPPIKATDAEALINGGDHAFERDVRRWFDNNVMEAIDVTLLADAEGNHDIERWELIGGINERFVVREAAECRHCGERIVESVDPGEADGGTGWRVVDCDAPGVEHPFSCDDNEIDAGGDGEGNGYPGAHEPGDDPIYVVVDTDTDDEVDSFDDEGDADDNANERNREAHEEGLMGFPFAWNTGWKVSKYDADLFARHGALVYRFDGEIIIGIDGAGYSFLGAHWGPAYLDRATENGWTVETDAGPRKVVR